MQNKLVINNISFSYVKNRVLEDISFSLSPGEITAILGPNGSGKSTLLLCLSGFLNYKGKIYFKGMELKTLKNKLRAKIISLASQNPIFPELTVEEYLLLARFPHLTFLGKYTQKDLKIVKSISEQLNLSFFLTRSLTELSGGEQKKILLAKTMIQDTPFVLLDEITSNLDPKVCINIASFLKKISKEQQKTILISSHDLNFAALFCSSLIFLKKGRIIAKGKTKDVFKAEILEEVYETKVKVYPHPEYALPQAFFCF